MSQRATQSKGEESQVIPPMKPNVTLTSAQKLATASHLYWSARELKTRSLRRLHPDWSEARVQTEVRRVFMHSSGLNR